jgi:hypothetical protein
MLQRRLRRGHPDPRSRFFFESRCVKKGDRTPGVARQTFAATTSRPRNCVVLLHLASLEGDFHRL